MNRAAAVAFKMCEIIYSLSPRSRDAQYVDASGRPELRGEIGFSHILHSEKMKITTQSRLFTEGGNFLTMQTEIKSTFLEELRWRGFLEATTSDDIDTYLSEARRTMYVGFDPTADSLHLGNLIPVMALAHAQRHGHRPLVLVGGGTGLIGDPSGKTSERTLLTKEKADYNATQIRSQLNRFFDLSSNDKALMLN